MLVELVDVIAAGVGVGAEVVEVGLLQDVSRYDATLGARQML